MMIRVSGACFATSGFALASGAGFSDQAGDAVNTMTGSIALGSGGEGGAVNALVSSASRSSAWRF